MNGRVWQETFMLHAADGAALHVSLALPAAGESESVVCIVHGIGEHGGRYAVVAEALTGRGAAVFALDHRGHGRSQGKRGHASVRNMTDDAVLLLLAASARFPGRPLFLYGHSMGGNVALSCALRHRPAIDGLILSSPWLRLAFNPPWWKLAIGRLIGRLLPSMTMSTGLDSGALYRNGEQSRRDSYDELMHTRVSSELFFSIMDEGCRSVAEAGALNVPTLILHGTEDRVTSFAASRETAERAGQRCEFVAWEGGYHELHHDREAERVLAFIGEWVRARSGRGDCCEQPDSTESG
ncbi:alpha/beta hydrolase [Paenibacillus darwinianus]|uniref:Alpha/beta hydrolase n=1 Tax=Paenibacillus darwinianus TaxID=1380763 RepID=A0A9W5RYR9_9BACL|nr:alpha/beta hydrolase [Paenibacillus darwinianus]EXX85077.1 alpha/beta hydrolase [Paenibacillus darwinianus]EXX85120.1 alpha/beta hydrolase [Paenibacillus darwinianus]EXX86360.1 alpha/beta hydrolase [Paenibacillus darwinianus]